MTPDAGFRFWPTPLQVELLGLALAPAAEAEARWQGVRRQLEIERLEPGSFEVLPLVARKLNEAGVEDELIGRLRGITKRSWLKNQLLVQRGAATASELEARGVRFVFLEGPALGLRYYGELALRPTSFLHVLVDRGREATAEDAFVAAGWRRRPDDGHLRPFDPRFLHDDDGHVGVLRTTVAPDFAVAGDRGAALDEIWRSVQPQELEGGASTPVPAATELLLAVCAYGARRSAERSTQWLLDAAMILRSERVDAQRLLELARTTGQALRLLELLRYLQTLPGAQVPTEVVTGLAEEPTTWRRRLAYDLASGRLHSSVAELVAEHLALSAERAPTQVVVAAPGFLRERWELGSARAIPPEVARRAVRAVRARRR